MFLTHFPFHSYSPSDAPTKVEFGLSSSTSSTSRVDSFTLVPKDEGLRSDYDAQRPFMESSIVSSSYNASCERSAVQPLPNLRVHNRVSSEPCFPSLLGRQTILLRSEHSILHTWTSLYLINSDRPQMAQKFSVVPRSDISKWRVKHLLPLSFPANTMTPYCDIIKMDQTTGWAMPY